MASLKNIVNKAVLIAGSVLALNGCSVDRTDISSKLEARISEYSQNNKNKNDNNNKIEEDYSLKLDLYRYNRWIERTIKTSLEEKSSVIVVDKSKYELNLYDKGSLVKKYNIELGYDPVNRKLVQGDNKTPEGFYRIVKKRTKTRYYRALLLDYPNLTDKARFERARLNNEITDSDKIGNLIEIHGNGSGRKGNDGGRNWTLGCIALSDEDMDDLFKRVKNETLVTIVRFSDLD